MKQRDVLAPRIEFALKTIDTSELKVRGLLAQASREVLIHTRASKHPNIVSMVDFCEEQEYLHLILEFCPMYTLAHYGAPFPDAVVKCVLSQVAAALDFLHNEVKCIHRDVTPGNLMVCALKPALVVKLGDFGWAIDHAESSTANKVKGKAGTIQFMAPEVLNEEEYSYSVDIYSLGRVLSYCVNTKLPAVNDQLQIYLNVHHRAMLATDASRRPTTKDLAAIYKFFNVSGLSIQ